MNVEDRLELEAVGHGLELARTLKVAGLLSFVGLNLKTQAPKVKSSVVDEMLKLFSNLTNQVSDFKVL